MHLGEQLAAGRDRGSSAAFSGRRNCGGSPVYSGGVTQMSRLAAIAGGPPSRLGVTARSSRSRQSPPASIAPISSSIASTARKPHGSRAASPAARQPDPQPARQRLPCAAGAPPTAAPPAGRAARSAGRRAPAAAGAQARSRARCGGAAAMRSGSDDAAEPPRQGPAESRRRRPSSTAAWPRPGSSGSRSNRARTRKQPRIASAGQQAGQTRSHSSAARARRSRAANGAATDGDRRAVGHAAPRFLPVVAPSAGSASQAGMVSSDSSASIARPRPDRRRSGRRRPAPPAPAGGCCRSSS